MSVHNAQRAEEQSEFLFLVSAQSPTLNHTQAGMGPAHSSPSPADFFHLKYWRQHPPRVLLCSLKGGFLNNLTGELKVSRAGGDCGMKRSTSVGAVRQP